MSFLPKNQFGFSLVEMMIASGLTGALVMGASTVMNTTVGSQKKIEIQSVLEREFALGSQIAANAEIIRKVVNPNPADTCIIRDRNFSETRAGRAAVNCQATHSTSWTAYPTNPPPALKLPVFNNSFSLLNSNCVADPNAQNRCHAVREMAWRWVCSPEECSGIETKVVVRPINSQTNNFRPREVIVKIDRRQLFTRDEIQFLCSSRNESLTTVDYDQARDICTAQPITDCVALPNQTYNPFAAASTNCAPPLQSSCPDGYEFTGIHNGSVQCRPPPPPNGDAGSSDTVAPPIYTPNPPPETRINSSTTYQTYTNTVVTTVTNTVIGTPPPTCNMATHQIYRYYHPWNMAYFFTVDPNDTVATGQDYARAGGDLTVFDTNCPGVRERTALTSCFVDQGGIGIHYMATTSDGCGHGGTSGYIMGWVENTPSVEAPRGLYRYRYVISGTANRWDTGYSPTPPAGWITEGGMGNVP